MGATMRSLGIGAALVWTVLLSAQSPQGAEKSYSIPVMTLWRAKPAAAVGEIGEKFFQPEFDDSAWEKTDIKDGKQDPFSDRYVFYRRWVEVPGDWKGRKIKVLFGGVDDNCVVYMNGRKVARHKGYDQPFEADVTEAVKTGDKNLLAVLADNSRGRGCGIWKGVSLVLAGEFEKEKAAAEARREAAARAALRLGDIPYRIVYESYRDGNWELYMVNADGSHPVNLTRTSDANELYPHVSPDGTKVCFVVDEGPAGAPTSRDLYYMNMDGTGRTLVAGNAREGCWNAGGTAIAYLKGEFDRFSYDDFANREVFFHDLKTQKHTQHPNKDLHHLYNLCWSPDGKWFVATVHAGMGYSHAILAIEADGTKVFDLKIPGCRPDVSPDGKRIAWGSDDFEISIGDLDFSSPLPRVTNRRCVVRSDKPMEAYHVDWSPDGKYVALSRGPTTKALTHHPAMIGMKAKGWHICVADAAGTNVWTSVTTDANCNKEPDWAPVKERHGP